MEYIRQIAEDMNCGSYCSSLIPLFSYVTTDLIVLPTTGYKVLLWLLIITVQMSAVTFLLILFSDRFMLDNAKYLEAVVCPISFIDILWTSFLACGHVVWSFFWILHRGEFLLWIYIKKSRCFCVFLSNTNFRSFCVFTWLCSQFLWSYFHNIQLFVLQASEARSVSVFKYWIRVFSRHCNGSCFVWYSVSF